jgi:hypothetical protein
MTAQNQNKGVTDIGGATNSAPQKVTVKYAKISEKGDTQIYAIELFGSIVYFKVKVTQKQTSNIFVWKELYTLEKVSLDLNELGD